MEFFYVLIIEVATLGCAICGMGGGVIIKPIMDAVSGFSAMQISVISCTCVLAMSVSSLIKHFAAKTLFQLRSAVCLAIGAVVGGIAGDFVYDAVCNAAAVDSEYGESVVKLVQNAVLALLMLFVLVYMLVLHKKGRCFHVKNVFATAAVGLALGMVSSFLSIGGGPINVCVFCLVFGMDIKEAGPNSLITIVFTQTSKLIKMAISGTFSAQPLFDGQLSWPVFALMIAVAVVGGLLGAILNKKLSACTVGVVYYAAIGVVLCLNLYNVIYNAELISV